MSQTQPHDTLSDPLAFTALLTPPTQAVVNEYLLSPFTFGEVLENKPSDLCQQVLAELSQYVDIRYPGGQVELYFKRKDA
jgi:hypothetical protein